MFINWNVHDIRQQMLSSVVLWGSCGTLWTPLVTALEDSIANLRNAADHAKFILLAQFHRIKIMF